MIYRIGIRVQDALGCPGTIIDSVALDPPKCSAWQAFVEWDNGETDWVNHESLTALCPKCGREQHPWPLPRPGNRCSPPDWQHCIRHYE